MGNLDEFSAALSQVTAQATRAAASKAKTRRVIAAAASGGEDAVRRAVAGMSTAELQRLQQELER